MASINISIREDAYLFLRSLKSRDQSFSDVILGMKKRQKGVLRFYGVLKDADWNQKEKDMLSLRRSFEDRL